MIAGLAPDVVHLHSSKAGVLGRAAAFTTGDAARVFYSPRGLPFLQEDYSPRARALFRRIEWACARLGGTVVACSASEEALVREHLRPRRVALVENAVDVESVIPRVDRGDGLMRIGIVGRITYARNPPLFAELARRHASGNTRFVWVGGGEADDARLLQEAGVEVTGWKSRPEALAEMSRLDIYLHPSRWEGMPIALIEAQIAGLPAVATDVVGNRDVIREGETGFVRADAAGLSEVARAADCRSCAAIARWARAPGRSRCPVSISSGWSTTTSDSTRPPRPVARQGRPRGKLAATARSRRPWIAGGKRA